MRIFLDANILFSAAKGDGAIRRMLRELKRGGHELFADRYVVEEARRNIALKAPGSQAELETLVNGLSLVATVAGVEAGSLEALPEKDRPVLAGAIRARCDYLVTGDRLHFGRLYGKMIECVEVVAPAQLAERLL